MSGKSGAAIFLGTRAGLFRFQAGNVTPLSGGSERITAMVALPGARLLAATATSGTLRVDGGGQVERAGDPPQRDAIASLLCVGGRGAAPTVLAGTESGWLLASEDAGSSFRRVAQPGTPREPLQLVAIPGRPRSALVVAGRRGWLLADSRDPLEPWFAREDAAIAQALPHPDESHLWLARTADALLRSSDGARTFQPVPGWPRELRPRLLHFLPPPEAAALAIAFPAAVPPDPTDPSPLWESKDAGQSFHAVPSRLLDHARDPSGELTAIATLHENGHDRDVVALATDRGELLTWRRGTRPADLEVDGLPPVDLLLAAPSLSPLDPSTSGVYVLP